MLVLSMILSMILSLLLCILDPQVQWRGLDRKSADRVANDSLLQLALQAAFHSSVSECLMDCLQCIYATPVHSQNSLSCVCRCNNYPHLMVVPSTATDETVSARYVPSAALTSLLQVRAAMMARKDGRIPILTYWNASHQIGLVR